METEQAVAHLNSVTPDEVSRYSEYLQTITPKTNEELFRRWLFAYASVHTPWKYNCKLYGLLEDLSWLGDQTRLKELIIQSQAGLYNHRTGYIHDFTSFFWTHPDWFWKAKGETWTGYRDRIQNVAPGIGRAKSSFVVEMVYPTSAEVICTDTHVMQLYGKGKGEISKGKVKDKEEQAMEFHWVNACSTRSLPPPIARWIFWDRKQGHPDSRYWSWLLESTHEPHKDIKNGTRFIEATCIA